MKKVESLTINWSTVIAVGIFHLLAVVSLFFFSWQNLLIAGVLFWVSGSLGIGLGYHRLLTHRGFKTPKWFEYFLTLCGMLALQSGAISWVTTHRLHHAFTETEKDPHTVTKGLYWAHIGWIFQGTGQGHDETIMRRYAPDLMKDKVHVAMNKYYWLPSVILGLGLLWFGGVGAVLWGIFLRTVLVWQTTWLVNSATHAWGKRRFETSDSSTNNAVVALLTFGEGWHNNHHAFPRSARHGLTWKEIDINWLQILLLEKLGLARDVYAYKLNETTIKTT
ncbi:MAG: acyl-CoA desaturase [Acidobacteria bacterium]|nr:MAG: acyl-CoA desaturase [Acidobacteriota bacterium]GIU81248.1 MAG: delta-9 desaturase [Pyrinomonadaceae bacterium]